MGLGKISKFLKKRWPLIRSFLDTHFTIAFEWITVIFFTVCPTLFSLLGSKVNSKQFDVTEYYLNGEFLLYAVGFLSGAYIVFDKAKKSGKANLIKIANRASVIFLIGIAVAYAFVKRSETPDLSFLKMASSISMGVGVIFLYYSLYLNEKESPDIIQQHLNDQNNLSRQLS